jgi:hypothetical protein
MFKNLRIDFLNWLAAGKIVLEKGNPQEYKSMSYAIAGGHNNMGSITLGPHSQGPLTGQTLTIKITPANGGNIVSVQSQSQNENLYIISDDADFDRELGKIITMSKLKE